MTVRMHETKASSEQGSPYGEAGGPPAALTLTKCHISNPRRIEGAAFPLEVALNGDVACLKGQSPHTGIPTPTRGRITGFSAKSRRNMIERLASLNKQQVTLSNVRFVTITYPGEFPTDNELWRKHLNNFLTQLEQSHGLKWVVWKLEPQKRLAPHFHLLCEFDTPPSWYHIALRWNRIAGAGCQDHLRVALKATHHNGGEFAACQTPRSWRGVAAYASKYASKTFDVEDLPEWWHGCRFWGSRGDFPRSICSVNLTADQFVRMRRLFRGYARSKGYKLRYGSVAGCMSFIPETTVQHMLAAVDSALLDDFLFARRVHLGVLSGHEHGRQQDSDYCETLPGAGYPCGPPG